MSVLIHEECLEEEMKVLTRVIKCSRVIVQEPFSIVIFTINKNNLTFLLLFVLCSSRDGLWDFSLENEQNTYRQKGCNLSSISIMITYDLMRLLLWISLLTAGTFFSSFPLPSRVNFSWMKILEEWRPSVWWPSYTFIPSFQDFMGNYSSRVGFSWENHLSSWCVSK